MKVVTICGSMRFVRQMREIAMDLETKRGWCVLEPIGESSADISEQNKRRLSDAHRKKIDLSDAVYIVNIGGYIGESVAEEIQYAEKQGKEVIFHET